MPAPRSAGILLYRWREDRVEVLLGHPGGPYWARKDEGAWMVPKGALEPGEASVDAARREFSEEVGPMPDGIPVPLITVRQNGGKVVEVFALQGDFDPAAMVSSEFELEWPPRSGKMQRFPELDRVAWLDLVEADRLILKSQQPVLAALSALLKTDRKAEQQGAS